MIQRVNQMIKYKYLSQESKKVRRKEKMVNMEKYNNTRIVKRETEQERKKERKTYRQTDERNIKQRDEVRNIEISK